MEDIEVKEPLRLDDGLHTGQIVRVEDRETPQGYNYVDVYIKEQESELELKWGAPRSGSTESKLMKTLANFTDIKAGIQVNPAVILADKEVTFMTMKEKKGDKEYVKIVDGSLKPAVTQEAVQ